MAGQQRAAKLKVRSTDKPDPSIVLLTSLFVVAGLLLVFDTTYFYSKTYYGGGYAMIGKHLVSIVLGLIAMLVLSNTRSDTMERWARPAFIVATLAVVATAIPQIGTEVNGARRWISLGFFNLQPAEFAKLAFVVFVASELSRKGKKLADWRRGIGPILGFMVVLQLPLLLQPDFGSIVLVGLLAMSLMFLAGVPLRQLGVVCGGLGGLAAILIQAEPYRVKRFLCFLNPWEEAQGACYQLVQSFRTFASGGYTGIGLGSSLHKAGWLPEAHTDFVFAIVGEEGGLVGATIVLAFYSVFVYRGFRVAHRHPAQFGQLLAAGIALMFALQVLINMGVVLGMLPTKGLVLPFLSYGGSSMIVMLAAVGILMSVSRELRER
jgi:cell division protein FtsW